MSSPTQTIGTGVIKITLDGLEKVQAKLDLAKKRIQGFTDAAGSLGNKAFGTFAAGTATISGLLAVADPVRFSEFTTALQVLSLHIGRIFIPLLKAATDKVNEWIEYFRNMDDATRQNIVSWTKWVLGGLLVVGVLGKTLALIGPIITMLSQLSTVVIGLGRAAFGVLSNLPGLIGGLSAAFSGLGKAAMLAFSNPLLLAIVAVVALVGVLVYKLRSAAAEIEKFAETSERLQGKTNNRQAALREQTKGMSDEDKEKFLRQEEQTQRQKQLEAQKKVDAAGFMYHDAGSTKQARKEQDEAEEKRRAAHQELEDMYRKKNGLNDLDRRTKDEKGGVKNGKSGDFTPKMRMDAPQITSITDAWKRVQTSVQNDPAMRYQQELLNLTQDQNKSLSQIEENTGRGQVARAG